MQTISIDRSGLVSGPQHLPGEPTDANAATKKEEETEMAAHIKALIQVLRGREANGTLLSSPFPFPFGQLTLPSRRPSVAAHDARSSEEGRSQWRNS